MASLRNLVTRFLHFLGWIGDFSRLTNNTDEVDSLAVVVQRNFPWCTTHAGIAHRSGGKLHILHLATHETLDNSEIDHNSKWIYAIPRMIYKEDRDGIAAFCRRIQRANRSGTVPYAFEYEVDTFFDFISGKYISNCPDGGLTCSTFVACVFRSALWPLIKLESWPSRASEEDKRARQWAMDLWKKQKSRPDLAKRADELAPSIGVRRVSPEQVAASCLQRRTPAGYRRCTEDGIGVLLFCDAKYGKPTSGYRV